MRLGRGVMFSRVVSGSVGIGLGWLGSAGAHGWCYSELVFLLLLVHCDGGSFCFVVILRERERARECLCGIW